MFDKWTISSSCRTLALLLALTLVGCPDVVVSDSEPPDSTGQATAEVADSEPDEGTTTGMAEPDEGMTEPDEGTPDPDMGEPDTKPPADCPNGCEDNNPCTDDLCDEKGCTHLPNALLCDDGNECTEDDTCASGGCKGSTVTCDDGVDCTVDDCDKTSGCTVEPDDTACNDNELCTDDSCHKTKDCQSFDNILACSDGDACTEADQCFGGACKGVTLDCDDNVTCTADSCLDGKCKHDAGSCTCTAENAAATCDDSNPCTTDGCVAGKCVATPTDGACSDDDLCTLNDACSNGTCTGTQMDCSDDFSCTTDTCSAGTCSSAIEASGASCLIDGVCYAAGATNPFEPCDSCKPAESTTAWSKAGDLGASDCNPGASCLEIWKQNPTLPSGAYWVDPGGATGFAPQQVYCQMLPASQGGGWTLVVGINASDKAHLATSAVSADGLIFDSAFGKYSDALINAMTTTHLRLETADAEYVGYFCADPAHPFVANVSSTVPSKVSDQFAEACAGYKTATHWEGHYGLDMWNGNQCDVGFPCLAYSNIGCDTCVGMNTSGTGWGQAGRLWVR